jgi:hypothetical protein
MTKTDKVFKEALENEEFITRLLEHETDYSKSSLKHASMIEKGLVCMCYVGWLMALNQYDEKNYE